MSHQEQTDQNQEAQSGTSRRSLLAALGLGGGAAATLPTSWTKPVIDSVILPAHAAGTTAFAEAGTYLANTNTYYYEFNVDSDLQAGNATVQDLSGNAESGSFNVLPDQNIIEDFTVSGNTLSGEMRDLNFISGPSITGTWWPDNTTSYDFELPKS